MAGAPRSFRKQLALNSSLIVGFLAAAFVALYLFSGDIAAESEKIVSDKAFIARQTAVLGALAKLKNDASQTAPYLAAMQQLLPKHDDLIGFPKWVASVGESNHVSAAVTFTGKNAVGSASAPATDGFNLAANGSGDDLVAFLIDLERRSPGFIITLDTFDLVWNGSRYNLTAQGQVYSRSS